MHKNRPWFTPCGVSLPLCASEITNHGRCAHAHKAWKRCKLWPHVGEKRKRKKSLPLAFTCASMPTHTSTHLHVWFLRDWSRPGKEKKGRMSYDMKDMCKVDDWHSASPSTHTLFRYSAKLICAAIGASGSCLKPLRCSTLQWLNFAFYWRHIAGWEMKTNVTNNTLCSSTLSSLH